MNQHLSCPQRPVSVMSKPLLTVWNHIPGLHQDTGNSVWGVVVGLSEKAQSSAMLSWDHFYSVLSSSPWKVSETGFSFRFDLEKMRFVEHICQIFPTVYRTGTFWNLKATTLYYTSFPRCDKYRIKTKQNYKNKKISEVCKGKGKMKTHWLIF